jgi:hypothetical protein
MPAPTRMEGMKEDAVYTGSMGGGEGHRGGGGGANH